ncbi:ABC transporter permease [Aliicoccus persicus]|nr:ABC transporter permease [Aliicoccus persicus]
MFLKEQRENLGLIWKLNIYDYKTMYSRQYLGPIWIILMPVMSALVLWLVFGLGIRGVREPVQDIPFIMHLLTGIFSFGFISSSITGGASAILDKQNLMTKMKFPASVLISIKSLGNIMNVTIVTSIILIVSIWNGYTDPITYIGFFYFLFATVCFTYAIALTLSATVVVVRDVKNILGAFIRLAFFMSPVIWSLESANPLMQVITAYNPFAYLIMTYRYTFLYEDLYIYGGATQHIYFWTLTIFLFYIGLHVHYRFRNRFVDYMR